jgi:outer membrane protein assembly factor BamB
VDPEARTGDIFHANAVRYLNAQQAASIPNAEEGDVLVSLRDSDTLIVLDLDDETVKWATRGPWHMQHDPRVLNNGNILLLDNRGDLTHGGHSRVLEFNPRTQVIEWEWPGEQDVDFYTPICGTAGRLENGNTLIAESNRGRLFEITPDGEIVWEFYIPERAQYTNYKTTKVLNSMRIDPATLTFLD